MILLCVLFYFYNINSIICRDTYTSMYVCAYVCVYIYIYIYVYISLVEEGALHEHKQD